MSDNCEIGATVLGQAAISSARARFRGDWCLVWRRPSFHGTAAGHHLFRECVKDLRRLDLVKAESGPAELRILACKKQATRVGYRSKPWDAQGLL